MPPLIRSPYLKSQSILLRFSSFANPVAYPRKSPNAPGRCDNPSLIVERIGIPIPWRSDKTSHMIKAIPMYTMTRPTHRTVWKTSCNPIANNVMMVIVDPIGVPNAQRTNILNASDQFISFSFSLCPITCHCFYFTTISRRIPANSMKKHSESMVLEVSDKSEKCRYSKQLQLCIRGENQEPACDD